MGIIMENVRQLKSLTRESDLTSDYAFDQRLNTLKQDIKREWQRYKRSRWFRHGETTRDNILDMFLVYLVKRGVL